MAGTREGGLQAAKTMLARDPDHYKKIGSEGGKAGTNTTKGFAHPTRIHLAKEMGRKGARSREDHKN